MKDINFKAWDKLNKRMITWDKNNWSIDFMGSVYNDNNELYTDDCILLLSTGLNDIKGSVTHVSNCLINLTSDPDKIVFACFKL